MASFEEHCRDCVKELGEPFEKVHLWLDAYWTVLGPKHRSVRHHSRGVEEIRVKWGDRAARAAEIHIIKDCYGKPVPTEAEMQTWQFIGSSNADSQGTTIIEE